jgi:ankyrin repeat protein
MLLLEKGACPLKQDNEGSSALHFAVKCHVRGEYQGKIIELLLKYGAEINLRDKRGETPLFVSIAYSSPSSALKLLQCGADANIANDEGISPLHHEVKKGFYFHGTENLQNLIDFGAFIDARDTRGRTPLLNAVVYNKREIFDFLLENGCDVKDKDDLGCSICHLAAESDNVEFLELAIEKGLDIEATSIEKQTALHYAAKFGSINAVEFLVSIGAKLDVTDVHGDTPRMLAFLGQNMGLVQDDNVTAERYKDICKRIDLAGQEFTSV